MTKPLPATGLLSIYSGQQCLGFALARGRQGVEAFDVEGVSLGCFPDQKAAMAAVSAAANASSTTHLDEAAP
jgi:hypothetical protein